MDWYNWDYCNLEEIVGKTPVAIDNKGTEVHFRMSDGSHYVMTHIQSCCENVSVEDIAGDLNDLLNHPISLAEQRSNRVEIEYGDAQWTFYELQGPGGYATIRWYGTSNGYYGTGVDFMRADKPKVENNPAF
jgi:hypothetical protein